MYVTPPSWYISSAGSLRFHCTSICQKSEGNIFQRIVAIWCYSALNLLYQARPSREFWFGDVGVSLSRDFCRNHTRGPGRLERWCETSWMNEAPKLQVCLNVNNSPGVRNHIIGWLSLSCESLYQWDDIFYIPVPGPPQELYGQLVFVMVLLLGTTEKTRVVVTMSALSSLVALVVVIMTTTDATIDDKVDNMTTFGFWNSHSMFYCRSGRCLNTI